MRKFLIKLIIILSIIFCYQYIILFLILGVSTLYFGCNIINYEINNDNQSIITLNYENKYTQVEKLIISYNLPQIIFNLNLTYQIQFENVILKLKKKNEIYIQHINLLGHNSILNGETENLKLQFGSYTLNIKNLNLSYINSVFKFNGENIPVYINIFSTNNLYSNNQFILKNLKFIYDLTKPKIEDSFFIFASLKNTLNDESILIESVTKNNQFFVNIKANFLYNNFILQNNILTENNTFKINSSLKGQIFLFSNFFNSIPNILVNSTFDLNLKYNYIYSYDDKSYSFSYTGNIQNGILPYLYSIDIENKNINLKVKGNNKNFAAIGNLLIKNKPFQLDYTIKDMSKIFFNSKEDFFHVINLKSSASMNLYDSNLAFNTPNIIINFNLLKDQQILSYIDIDFFDSKIDIPFINVNKAANDPFKIRIKVTSYKYTYSSFIKLQCKLIRQNVLKFVANLGNSFTFFKFNINEGDNQFSFDYLRHMGDTISSNISIMGDSLDGRSIQFFKKLDNLDKTKIRYYNAEYNNNISIDLKQILAKSGIYKNVILNFWKDNQNNYLDIMFDFNKKKNYIIKNDISFKIKLIDIHHIINNFCAPYDLTEKEKIYVNMKKNNDVFNGKIKVENISFKTTSNTTLRNLLYFVNNIRFKSKITYAKKNIFINEGVFRSNILTCFNLYSNIDLTSITKNNLYFEWTFSFLYDYTKYLTKYLAIPYRTKF